MANFNSFSPFDIYNVNLYWYSSNVWDAALEDNVNVVINGRSYQDVYWVNGYDGFDDLELDFAGSNITTDAFGQVTGGTVNFVAEFDLNSNSLMWYAEGISVSAVAIYNAAYTPSNQDEISIIQSALSGNDQILLSPFDDRMSGFAGDDTITGGLGRDTLSGGSGNDIFLDTAAGLHGDTITDFSAGDRIIISDANPANFSFSLAGSTLNFTGGSLSFGSALTGTLVATAAVGGGVQLMFGGPSPITDARNDFNGDGRSDILWRHDAGHLTEWLGTASGGFTDNGANAFASIATTWNVAGIGDFNGDGRDDILWRHDAGHLTEWLGTASGGFTDNGANAFASIATTWNVAGIGDFNGDGRDDILWRHDAGHLTEWLGTASGGFTDNGANAFASIATTWNVAGIGDFNGDGRDDILWRHDAGHLTEWLGTASGGFTDNGANAFASIATTWNVAGIGDFNGDGRDDILWRHDAGHLTEWLGTASGGFTDNGANAFASIATTWNVAGIGDFNGDGRDDILWRHDAGHLTEWLGTASGGFADNGANAFASIATTWHVQSPDYALI